MMKKTIEMEMTAHPHSINGDLSLAQAEREMKALGVRHLPVLKAGRIVGMLSDRDVKLMEKFIGSFTVEDAMTPDPYVVEPSAPLALVAETMAAHRFGSAIVAEHGKILGIFTAHDGLRLLADSFR